MRWSNGRARVLRCGVRLSCLAPSSEKAPFARKSLSSRSSSSGGRFSSLAPRSSAPRSSGPPPGGTTNAGAPISPLRYEPADLSASRAFAPACISAAAAAGSISSEPELSERRSWSGNAFCGWPGGGSAAPSAASAAGGANCACAVTARRRASCSSTWLRIFQLLRRKLPATHRRDLLLDPPPLALAALNASCCRNDCCHSRWRSSARSICGRGGGRATPAARGRCPPGARAPRAARGRAPRCRTRRRSGRRRRRRRRRRCRRRRVPHAPRGGGRESSSSIAASGCTIRPGRSSGARRPCVACFIVVGAPPPPPPPTFFGKPPRRVAPIPGNPEGSGGGTTAGSPRPPPYCLPWVSGAMYLYASPASASSFASYAAVSLFSRCFRSCFSRICCEVAHVPPPRRLLPVGLRDRRRAAPASRIDAGHRAAAQPALLHLRAGRGSEAPPASARAGGARSSAARRPCAPPRRRATRSRCACSRAGRPAPRPRPT